MDYIFDKNRPQQDMSNWFPDPQRNPSCPFYSTDRDYDDKTLLGSPYQDHEFTEENMNMNLLKDVGWNSVP